MSTNKTSGPNANPKYSSESDFQIPSCTIEDVDRAVFNLFEKDIGMFYLQQNDTLKIPVIFATGERFAVLRRKQPLRDKAGALILPLVSIMRTGVEQNLPRGAGTNQAGDITIKKKLSSQDPSYQRIVNKERLEYEDDRATKSHYLNNVAGPGAAEGMGTEPGTIATRTPAVEKSLAFREGKLISDKLGNNIYEIYTIPAPKYFNSTYEITFWAQYTQQMNHMITAVMSSYHSQSQRTFRIESDKGYYFVAYVASSFSSGNNFDDFTDSERIIRYSFNLDVTGYIVNPKYPGSTSTIRKYISAPKISFDMTQVNSVPNTKVFGGTASGDPNDYILQGLSDTDDPAVSSIVGGKGVVEAGDYYQETMVGGEDSGRSPLTVSRKFIDPATGEEVKQELKIKMRNQRKGETVYREQITHDLGNLIIEPK